MNFRRHIPNILTIGNLVCGAIVVLMVAREGFNTPAVFLLFLAGFFDLLDGAIARALKVSGELGKQLDSLADVVSFGLAPSLIIFSMLENVLSPEMQWLKFGAFINVACAAIRLAKFNISTDQKNDFSGMPSPANGLFWASVAGVCAYDKMSVSCFAYAESVPLQFTLPLLAVTSFLMVSRIRMFSFKFRAGGFAANRIPYIYIGMVVLLPVITLLALSSFLLAIPLAIMLYMVMSVIYHSQDRKA